jgi:hypothetical protein
MTTAQATCPELLLERDRSAGPESTGATVSSLVRGFVARWRAGFEGYDDYFAEIERSLPPHVREQRRERRESNQLLLVAALCR